MSVLLNVVDVIKNYQHQVILDKIRLTISQHDCIAINGQQASGKSTLLKIIAGIVKADKGHVRAHADLDVMYCAPDTLEGAMTVQRFFESSMKNSGLSRNIWQQRCNDLVHEFNLFDYLKTPLRYVSHSVGQKVSLVHAFLSMVDVLILDDPTTYLDSDTIKVLIVQIQNYLRAGGAVILTDYNRELVNETANQFYQLHNHQLTAVSSFEDANQVVARRMTFAGSMHSAAISPNVLERVKVVSRVANEVTLEVSVMDSDYVLRNMVNSDYSLRAFIDETK